MKDFYTIAEAAKRLDVDPSRIRQIILDGELETIKLDGRTKLIKIETFAAFERDWKMKYEGKKKPGPRKKTSQTS